MSVERNIKNERESVWDSRFFKGGLVTFGLGSVLGIGVVVELGALAVVWGASWNWIRNRRIK